MTATNKRRSSLCRLLQIVTALESERRPNARQLAEECEVSRRTIFRDLETIETAGLRVEYAAARQGYRIASAASAPKATLEEREVVALAFLANRGAEDHAFGLAGSARSGLIKLFNNLPEGSRQRAEAVEMATRVEPPTPRRDDARRAVYDRLLDGLMRRVHVRLTVRAPGRGLETTRMALYRLFEGREGWCLIGRSSLHRRVRMIPLAQVESAEPTDDPSTVPPRFRAERWLERSWTGEPGPGRFESPSPVRRGGGPIDPRRSVASLGADHAAPGRPGRPPAHARPAGGSGGMDYESGPAFRGTRPGPAATVGPPDSGPGRPAILPHAPDEHGGPISGVWVVDAPRSGIRIRLVLDG